MSLHCVHPPILTVGLPQHVDHYPGLTSDLIERGQLLQTVPIVIANVRPELKAGVMIEAQNNGSSAALDVTVAVVESMSDVSWSRVFGEPARPGEGVLDLLP